jgi:hypothetical protein
MPERASQEACPRTGAPLQTVPLAFLGLWSPVQNNSHSRL